MTYFLVGLALLGLFLLLGRWFARASSHDLAQGARTFVAVFSALASTGLLFIGRFGLALITIVATVMAIRAIRRGRRGADPMDGGGPASEPVEVETDLLRMRLDRDSGDVSGAVRSGRFEGRDLGSLGFAELMDLLAEATGSDAQSTSLLEAYLDRRFPDWRDDRSGDRHDERRHAGGDGNMGMDEDEALQILGLERGADAEAIKQAHRRLMAKLHPDSGGSTFLATQINQAKDRLLGKARAKSRR